MDLGISLDERYEPIACMMYDSTDTDLAAVFAMPVIVLQDNDRLLLTLAGVLNIASVKVTVIAVVPANRADTVLLGQQLHPIALPLGRGHAVPFFSSPRSQVTSTPSTSA